jgi:hypothetical protein
MLLSSEPAARPGMSQKEIADKNKYSRSKS